MAKVKVSTPTTDRKGTLSYTTEVTGDLEEFKAHVRNKYPGATFQVISR